MPSLTLDTGAVVPRAMRFSPAEKTFVIRPHGRLWHVADDRGEAGGLFTTLDAALTFARRESANAGSARVVIVGGDPESAQTP